LEIESVDVLSTLGERIRLFQGTGNEIALSFRRIFDDDPFIDGDGVKVCVIVIDCFRIVSAFKE